jgi:hypothetical protein
MDASRINQIIDAYGAFLESPEQKRLSRLFLTEIPESLLPYPKEEIKEALNVYIRHFEKIGKKDQAQAFNNVLTTLYTFVSDEEAIKRACERLTKK